MHDARTGLNDVGKAAELGDPGPDPFFLSLRLLPTVPAVIRAATSLQLAGQKEGIINAGDARIGLNGVGKAAE